MRYRNINTGDIHPRADEPALDKADPWFENLDQWVQVPDDTEAQTVCPTCGRPTIESARDGVLARADAPTIERPADRGSKGDWVAYAVAYGADEDEAKAMTRDELVAAYGDR